MIVVSGTAGFIGSVLTGKLIENGFNELVVVDDFSFAEINKNAQKQHLFCKKYLCFFKNL